MLNETKTRLALHALSAAAWAVDWLEAASDSAHRVELRDLASRIRNEAEELGLLAEDEGFHPDT
jgi:hypothetical protein